MKSKIITAMLSLLLPVSALAQGWEYGVLSIHSYPAKFKQVMDWSENGQTGTIVIVDTAEIVQRAFAEQLKLTFTKEDTVNGLWSKILNHYGGKGWELVGCYNYEKPEDYMCHFKRPKPAAPKARSALNGN